ncbi:MAG: 16S rRNA (guanine(527)-N(7))-methyltransferase RsmG [Archangiaceae bacterium]|nr:16S rRNA (guanine(527)-N(7))-methyltransferase RsmG [Archangiaceae bacterium]
MGLAVDKPLSEGLVKLAVLLPGGAEERLLTYARELLKWNQKVNLTAITAPDEVVDKHLLDSLAVLPEVRGARSLLDLGAGAGLPGIPLALALPELQVTLVDAVSKKVGFIKHVIALLGLAGRVKAVHCRAEGRPESEGLPRAEAVISRAFMEVEGWRALANHYLEPGGRIIAMLGQTDNPQARRYALPLSGDPRAVAVFAAGTG